MEYMTSMATTRLNRSSSALTFNLNLCGFAEFVTQVIHALDSLSKTFQLALASFSPFARQKILYSDAMVGCSNAQCDLRRSVSVFREKKSPFLNIRPKICSQ